MDIDMIFLEAEENMKSAIEGYKSNLSKITTGRANPQILEGVKIDYYGELTPISNIASISVPEGRQLLIKPFDQTTLIQIVGAINNSSLGLVANNEGNQARINLPEMTAERRRELVKQFGKYTEQAKISIRSERQHANKKIKSDEEISEDDSKRYLDEIQKITDKYTSIIDDLSKQKEIDLTTI